VREGLAKGKLSFLLRGEKLKGSFALVKTKEAKQWLLLKHKDRFAAPVDVTTRNRSVLSAMVVEDLKVMPAHRIRATGARPFGQGRADAFEARADAR
jgi:bifunctional non-homologous end joining protein LigD